MNTSYTIGSLAKAADVPVSTLRYYERAGLLVPGRRSAGNYRVYEPADLERLQFIKAAQGSGFTLDDIRVMLGLASGNTQACDEVQDLIRHRMNDVAERLKNLKRVQKVLRASLNLCLSGSNEDHCKVIEHFSEVRT